VLPTFSELLSGLDSDSKVEEDAEQCEKGGDVDCAASNIKCEVDVQWDADGGPKVIDEESVRQLLCLLDALVELQAKDGCTPAWCGTRQSQQQRQQQQQPQQGQEEQPQQQQQSRGRQLPQQQQEASPEDASTEGARTVTHSGRVSRLPQRLR